MTPQEILISAAIGLVAGIVGGLCGIGGSVVMLPTLGLVFGYNLPDGAPDPDETRHHLYMASAMLVNVVVAGMAIRPHIRAGAIDRRVLVRMLPPMAVAMIAGVMLGDQTAGRVPKLVLVGFLFAFVAWSIFTAIKRLPEPSPEQERATPTRIGLIGLVAGLLGGFLAIGGGIVMVPAMQLVAKLPLRKSIAASAAAMCVASPIGAIMKFSTLPEHGLSRMDALTLGIAMAAGASVGSPLGARLTHRLRLPHLRLAVAIVLGLSGARLAGLF